MLAVKGRGVWGGDRCTSSEVWKMSDCLLLKSSVSPTLISGAGNKSVCFCDQLRRKEAEVDAGITSFVCHWTAGRPAIKPHVSLLRRERRIERSTCVCTLQIIVYEWPDFKEHLSTSRGLFRFLNGSNIHSDAHNKKRFCPGFVKWHRWCL